MNEYTKQANNFAKKHGVKLSFVGDPQYKKHFIDDKDYRFVFKCKLTRNKKSYTFDLGQSIQDGASEPTLYDVLTCLQKYEVGTFENFCGDFGYNEDSRKAEKVYNAVCEEYDNVNRLFSDCLDELNEIQ